MYGILNFQHLFFSGENIFAVILILNNISGYTTPYHLILYSVLVISVVYLFVRAQTFSLIRIKKLLKEKEGSLILIEAHLAELESKNKSITESLIYAQRIQEALLPSEDYFRIYFNNSFIFYKPKDIVSGDFFWIGENSGKIFVDKREIKPRRGDMIIEKHKKTKYQTPKG